MTREDVIYIASQAGFTTGTKSTERPIAMAAKSGQSPRGLRYTTQSRATPSPHATGMSFALTSEKDGRQPTKR